jgi:hypothetical protein
MLRSTQSPSPSVFHRLGRIALPRQPFEHLLLPESQVRLDADVRNQAPLHVTVDRFDVNPEEGFKFLGSEEFRDLHGVRVPRRA